MKRLVWILVITFIAFNSEAQLNKLFNLTKQSKSPTKTEIVNGLKEALSVGADTAVNRLSAVNGYYKDEIVKILLPDEADVIIDNISKIPNGKDLVEKVVLSINRAAEDASKEAAPIFKRSITSMNISDALGILNGNDHAATEYLKKTTYDQLYDLYKPKISTSTKKDLVGSVSTKEAWDDLTRTWNKFATSMVGKIGGYKPVNVDLDDYLTRKALDGLFIKIAEEEKQIRKDPVARVTDILKKVFG